MGLVKRLTGSRAAREAFGFLVARYLGLVRRTNRFVREPADPYDRIGPMMPVIAAMWHGQHFMVHFAKRREDRAASLVSRSGDGELNAIALRHLGIRAIRGSGARGRDVRAKGGVSATRAMLRALEAGEMVVMTADVPKVVPRLRPRHRHAGAAFRTAHRSRRRRHQPAHRFQELGSGEPRPPLRPRRDGARRPRSSSPATPMRRRSKRPARRWSAGSTRCTSAPTDSSGRRIRASRTTRPIRTREHAA